LRDCPKSLGSSKAWPHRSPRKLLATLFALFIAVESTLGVSLVTLFGKSLKKCFRKYVKKVSNLVYLGDVHKRKNC
jgi:hypothetical protein